MIGNENPDRAPDGIPHGVVGLTAFCSVVLAIALMVVLTGGRSIWAALAFAVVPIVVFELAGKAERERDHVHPSR